MFNVHCISTIYSLFGSFDQFHSTVLFYGKFNIRFFGAKVWNSIDDSLKSKSRACFKNLLKELIISNWYIDVLYFHLSEKMKNSSPNQQSADCRPTVGRLSTNCWPTVDQLSADCRPTVGRLSTNCRPTVVYRLLRKSSANSRPTVGRLSADCWQHVGNLLAACR